MSAEDEAPATATADICHAGSIRLPPFSEAKPQVWLAQIEEQLIICGISSNRLHYAHMVSALSTESYKITSVAVVGLTDNCYMAAKQVCSQPTCRHST